jgi:hypothetical protein
MSLSQFSALDQIIDGKCTNYRWKEPIEEKPTAEIKHLRETNPLINLFASFVSITQS